MVFSGRPSHCPVFSSSLPSCLSRFYALAAAPLASELWWLHRACLSSLPALLLMPRNSVHPASPCSLTFLQEDVFVSAVERPTGAPPLGGKAKKCDRFVNQAMEVGGCQGLDRMLKACCRAAVMIMPGARAWLTQPRGLLPRRRHVTAPVAHSPLDTR